MIKYICPECGMLQPVKDGDNRKQLEAQDKSCTLKEICEKCYSEITLYYGADDTIVSNIDGLFIYYSSKDIFRMKLLSGKNIIKTYFVTMFLFQEQYKRLKLYLFYKLNHNKDLEVMQMNYNYTENLLKGIS